MTYERLVASLGFEAEEKELLLKTDREISEKFPFEYERIVESYKGGPRVNAEGINGSAERMGIHPDLVCLWFFLNFSLEYGLPKYREKGIEDKIFVATMSNMAQYSVATKLKTGRFGMISKLYVNALRHLLELEAFRIGNLNFEIIVFKRDFEFDGHSIKNGEKCISVHIPRGTDFSDELCERSYLEAKAFFKKYYGIDNGIFHCHSWMLHPWLKEDISPESKIVKFGTKFSLYSIENDLAPNEYLFPKQFEEGDLNFESYPENTSMQRAAKKRLLNDMPYGCAEGVRFL